MTQPLDPHDESELPGGEFSYGPGLFPPGIANNEGQSLEQDDFGDNMHPPTKGVGSIEDNYARAVADRRTDTTDPESNRDFETLGNADRYGGNPPLVRADTQANDSQYQDPPLNKTPRKW